MCQDVAYGARNRIISIAMICSALLNVLKHERFIRNTSSNLVISELSFGGEFMLLTYYSVYYDSDFLVPGFRFPCEQLVNMPDVFSRDRLGLNNDIRYTCSSMSLCY